MNAKKLMATAQELVTDHKGLLAMDESTGTINKRFVAYSIPQTEEMRRKYRELIVTTPGLNQSISGAILFDETIRQQRMDGSSFTKILIDAGIIPGIKLDLGAKPLAGFPGEKVTEGLDGLRQRLVDYKERGARFAKWRAVINIGKGLPTAGGIVANAHALARYAGLCQEAGLVPIVETEVLMDGNHSLKHCFEVTSEVLHIVFEALYKQHILLDGMLLKPNMILPGLDSKLQETVDEVTEATVKCLLNNVPATVPGIAFLSGGQSPELATQRLNAMNKNYKSDLPWALTFSYGRALQQAALEAWSGEDANIEAAQRALVHRAKLNRAACMGIYTSEMEHKH